jgi:hypothetical protein
MDISMIYVLTHSFVENGYILWVVQKKTKKCDAKKAYSSIEICHFYIGYIESRFFLITTLWARRI